MKNLDKLIDKIIQWLDKGGDFLSGQIPDFCQQLMAYEAWKTEWTFYLCLSIAIVLLVLWLITWAFSLQDNEAGCGLAVVSFVLFIVAFVTVCRYMSLKEYQLAPKVYLIKQIRDLSPVSK